MEIKKITDDIHIIQLGGMESNIYLIKKKVLIDTGLGFHPKLLDQAFDSLNISAKDIERIIFTHGHYDHIGNTSIFKNAKIAIHTNDASILETSNNDKSCAFAFGKTLKPIKVDLKLNDKDFIRIDDIQLEVISTPGHTKGSICLYDKYNHILFSGDTIFSNTIGRTDLPGSDMNEMQSSLKKLKNLNISKILPGHGPIVKKDAEEHINQIINTYLN